MIRGRAVTVAGMPAGGLCISTTGCAWLPPATARETIRSTQEGSVDVPAFQASVSTDQFHTGMLRCWARLSVVESYSPYGGRNTQDPTATRLFCSAVARSISAAWPVELSVGILGWLQVWLPMRYPAATSERTRVGRTEALTPRLKNVAATPYRCRMFRIAWVVTPGPSSKVRATVFPPPGA